MNIKANRVKTIVLALLAVPVLLWGAVASADHENASSYKAGATNSFYTQLKSTVPRSKYLDVEMACLKKDGGIPKEKDYNWHEGPWVVSASHTGFKTARKKHGYQGFKCSINDEVAIYLVRRIRSVSIIPGKPEQVRLIDKRTLATKVDKCRNGYARQIRVMFANEHRTGARLKHGCVQIWKNDPKENWSGYTNFDNSSRGEKIGSGTRYEPGAADKTFYVMVPASVKNAAPVDFVCYKNDRRPDSLTNNKGRYKHWSLRANSTKFPKAPSNDPTASGFHYRGKGCKGGNGYVDVQLPNSDNAIVARLKPCRNKVRYAMVLGFDGSNVPKSERGARLLTGCVRPWEKNGIPYVSWDGWKVFNTLADK